VALSPFMPLKPKNKAVAITTAPPNIVQGFLMICTPYFGAMVCWHSRYNLGDKHDFKTPMDFRCWWEGDGDYQENGKGGECLSLYLYDHSGISMSTGRQYPFDCPWDSGQVGYIYVEAATIKKEYSAKRITKNVRQKVRELLECEVKAFDQFLTGDIYGYDIEDADGDSLDTCWGFYGFEYAKLQAMNALDYWVKEMAKREREANKYMAV